MDWDPTIALLGGFALRSAIPCSQAVGQGHDFWRPEITTLKAQLMAVRLLVTLLPSEWVMGERENQTKLCNLISEVTNHHLYCANLVECNRGSAGSRGYCWLLATILGAIAIATSLARVVDSATCHCLIWDWTESLPRFKMSSVLFHVHFSLRTSIFILRHTFKKKNYFPF